jgi:hypothetical protein
MDQVGRSTPSKFNEHMAIWIILLPIFFRRPALALAPF